MKIILLSIISIVAMSSPLCFTVKSSDGIVYKTVNILNDGSKSLPGGVVACWQTQSSVIQYESYRVYVTLSKRCNYNVVGTVYMAGQSKPLFIPAGSTEGYVDFEGLANGRRYSIDVEIKPPQNFPN